MNTDWNKKEKMKIKTTPSVIIRVLLWIIILIGGVYFGIKYDLIYFKSYFLNPFFHIISFLVGFILMKLSFHAAAIGGRELKKYGKEGDIPRLETNKLVTSGIFKCFRHPMLFGLSFIPLALALTIGSPTFILFIAPLEMIFILIMVLIFEEMECYKKFGKDYEIYKKKTPIFSKTLNCYKKLFIS